jgi:ribosomal-protein-alanine N-acetyltransferase
MSDTSKAEHEHGDTRVVHAPFMQGKRVSLRPLTKDDVPLLAVGENDPDVRRYARSWFPQTVEAREKRMAENPDITQKSDRILFVIHHEQGNKPIGFTSLGAISWPDRNAWLGLVIGDKSCWAKGYAVEAGAMLLDYAFGELGMHKIITGIFQPNKRSQAAAAKAGFKLRGVLKGHIFVEGKFVDSFTFELMRDDWLANRAVIDVLLRNERGEHGE